MKKIYTVWIAINGYDWNLNVKAESPEEALTLAKEKVLQIMDSSVEEVTDEDELREAEGWFKEEKSDVVIYDEGT